MKGLRSFGHRWRLVVTADNEPAILAEIMRRPEVGAIPVESVSMIRKTTALMKIGVKLFKGLLSITLVERKRHGSTL